VTPNLRDAGHLYTRLFVSREEQALALFKGDPELLKVRNHEGMNALLIAFATCTPTVIDYVARHGGGGYRDKTADGFTIAHLAAMAGLLAENRLSVAQYHGSVMLPLGERW